MNIQHFKMFVSVVESGSISKVAEQMHLSQSALSQQIRTMEQHFGAVLLERSPKGVVPTAIGKIVYEKSHGILARYEDIFSEIDHLQSQHRSLHIIATPTAYSYALPCTFYHVKNSYPEYSLEVEALSSDLIEEKVARGYADMGIVVGKPKDKTLTTKKVFSDRVYLVAGEKMEVPSHIQRDDIYHYPLLMLVKAQKTRQILDAHLSKTGVDAQKLHIPYTLESTESIKMSAINGYGLAFLPYMAIKKELYHKQLRMVECECLQFENHFYSIHRSSNQLGAELSKLIAYIERMLNQTIC